MAVGADREAKLWRCLRRRAQDGAEDCARTAQLVARIAHDAALFARLAESAPLARDDAAWTALGQAAGRALESSAESLEAGAPPDLAALRRFAPASPSSPIPWIAPAARLLMQDLTGLAHLRIQAATASSAGAEVRIR